jgi:hypothetical protein
MALSPKLSGLLGAQIQTTKLQELAVVGETSEIAGFGQDRER